MNLAARFAAAVLLSCMAFSAAVAADDPFIGTWVLNAAKSEAPLGAVPGSATVVVTSAGVGRYKSVSETTIAGATMRGEITFGLDGKDYNAIVDPKPPGAASLVQSFQRVGRNAYRTTVKMNGQAIATTLNEVSPDGKTMTLTTTGTGARTGATAVTVFDKRDGASAPAPRVSEAPSATRTNVQR
jgi:hypothetical protein